MAFVFFYRWRNPYNESLDVPGEAKGRPTLEDAIKDAKWRLGPTAELKTVNRPEYPALRMHGHFEGIDERHWASYDLFIVEADVLAVPFDDPLEVMVRNDLLIAEAQDDGAMWDLSERSTLPPPEPGISEYTLAYQRAMDEESKHSKH